MTAEKLDRLLDELQKVIEANDDRERCATENKAVSAKVAAQLPLVHRTGKRGSEALMAILNDRVLRAEAAKTSAERSIGEEKAVYFFLGYPAYPKGQIAFVVPQHCIASRASFTPFDSGALSAGFLHLGGQPVADELDQAQILMRYTGKIEDLERYTSSYLAAHFWNPNDYMQTDRVAPDFAAYHCLESPVGDRRAWTVEVRMHENLHLISTASQGMEIAVEREDMLEDIPDIYIGIAVARNERTTFAAWLARYISRALEKECAGL